MEGDWDHVGRYCYDLLCDKCGYTWYKDSDRIYQVGKAFICPNCDSRETRVTVATDLLEGER